MPSSHLNPSLIKLYEESQLHSRFHGHQAEFDSICWQHVHQHLSAKADWISKLRQEATRLGDRIGTELDAPQHNGWSETLEDVAHDLLLTYGKHFWPAWWNPPTDTPTLLPSGELLHVDMNKSRDGAEMQNKSVFRTTKNVYRLELHVESNIRSYLVSSVTTSEKVPEKQPLKAMQLVQNLLDFIGSQPAQPPHFEGGKRLTPISDIVEDKDLDLEEGEIQEQPGRKRWRIIPVSVPREFRSILSGATQPSPGNLQTPRASREPPAQVADLVNKYRQFHARRSSSKTSPASDRQSCSASADAKIENVDDTDVQGTSRESPELSVETAAKDDFRSGTGPGMSAMTSSKYCCWLDTCYERLDTVEQLVDHLENQHPIAYCDFIDVAAAAPGTTQHSSARTDRKIHCWLYDCHAAILAGNQPSLQSSPALGMQLDAKTVETVAPEALHMTETRDEKPLVIAHETEIALSGTPQAMEIHDEMPSILACEAFGEMRARKDAGEIFHDDYIADLRFYAGLPVIK